MRKILVTLAFALVLIMSLTGCTSTGYIYDTQYTRAYSYYHFGSDYTSCTKKRCTHYHTAGYFVDVPDSYEFWLTTCANLSTGSGCDTGVVNVDQITYHQYHRGQHFDGN